MNSNANAIETTLVFGLKSYLNLSFLHAVLTKNTHVLSLR